MFNHMIFLCNFLFLFVYFLVYNINIVSKMVFSHFSIPLNHLKYIFNNKWLFYHQIQDHTYIVHDQISGKSPAP